jgi:hypothetical protein
VECGLFHALAADNGCPKKVTDLAEKVKVDISLLREFVFTPSWRWDVLTHPFQVV